MTGPVTMLVTSLGRGGAETQVVQLAARLRTRGWRVGIVSLSGSVEFRQELEQSGVPFYSLGLRPGTTAIPRAFALVPLLVRFRPQVLHCHLFHANVLGRLLRLLVPVPVVISTLHSVAETARNSRNLRWRDRLYRCTDPLADATVAVARAVAQRHLAAGAVSAKRLRIIPNGVDTGRFKPDPVLRQRVREELGLGSEFVWLAVGRLMWKKGYQVLIQAFSRLPEAVLLVAGSGPDEAELKRLAASLGSRIRFLGQCQDIARLMVAADAYVQASWVEGLSVSLLEAAASALPLVATDAGGTSEVVKDGETGLLSTAGDAAQLAERMRWLMELSPAQRRQMGDAARALARACFDLEDITLRWEALYRQLPGIWT